MKNSSIVCMGSRSSSGILKSALVVFSAIIGLLVIIVSYNIIIHEPSQDVTHGISTPDVTHGISTPSATPETRTVDQWMKDMDQELAQNRKEHEEWRARQKEQEEWRARHGNADSQSVDDIFKTVDQEIAAQKEKHEKWKESQFTSAGITMHNYLLLREGMSYFSVVNILGKEGEELSSSGDLKVYAWRSWGGLKTITASFYDNKLAAKTQAGL